MNSKRTQSENQDMFAIAKCLYLQFHVIQNKMSCDKSHATYCAVSLYNFVAKAIKILNKLVGHDYTVMTKHGRFQFKLCPISDSKR